MSCIGKQYVFVNIAERINWVDVQEGIVYVCERENIAQMRCPCGCGDVIYINLIPDTHPGWTITGNTIKPSLNRSSGCRSHFSITNGITH